MTAVSASSGEVVAHRSAIVSPILRLAATEARRILLHPVHLLFGAALVAVMGLSGDPRTVFSDAANVSEGLAYLFLLYYGLVVFVAANLVASSPRRSGADTQLAATPVGGFGQTAAVCLGALGPAGVGGIVAAIIYQLSYGAVVPVAKSFAVAELLVLPLCALGAGLLGIAVARWLPWPVVPLVVLVGMVMWVALAQGKGNWAWSVPWTTSYAFIDDNALREGSQAWHAAYLAGLASLAALAALLRHPGHRRLLLGSAVLVTVATGVAGVLQLP